MSRESKKRTKEWLAKSPNIVLSRDVIVQQSAASLSGTTSHTAMQEGSSALSYAAKNGALDGVVFTCSPAIASGSVNVSLSLDGSVVASGSLDSTATFRAHDFKAGDDTEQSVTAGGVFETAYTIPTAIGDNGITGRQITARVLVTYEE